MTDVFISYSRRDNANCLEFVEALERANISYWLDREGIDGGAMWAQVIPKAIFEAKLIVLLASSNSLNSDNVFKEIDLAITRYKKTVLPVFIEPQSYDGYTKLDYHIHSLQHIELGKGTDKFESVIRFLHNRVGKPTQNSHSAVAANAPASSEIPSVRTVTPNAGDMYKQDGIDCLPEFAARPRYKTTHSHAVQNQPVIDEADSAKHVVAKTFTVSAMHLNHGIFIPGVELDENFGEHGSEVHIYYSGVPNPKIAKVDRNSNSNKSCRLNLGASFKKWLAQHFSIGMNCGLEVVPGDSPTVKFFVAP